MRFSHVLLTTALISFSGAAIAQSGWHHSGGMGMELLHGISLSDAQEAQVKSIMETAHTQSKAIMQQEHSARQQEMTTLLGSGSVTANDLASYTSAEQAARTQLDAIRVNTEVAIRNVLTPTQLSEASAKFQQLSTLRDQEHQVMQSSATTEH